MKKYVHQYRKMSLKVMVKGLHKQNKINLS